MTLPTRTIFGLLIAALCISPISALAQVDEEAAVALGKKGNCFKCHAVEKRKKAPSYREIAAKHKNNPKAEKDIYLHMTGNPTVKLDEGDELHEAPPTKSEAELTNLVKWILSR